MDRSFTEHGFLPETDPLQAFPHESPLAVLDEIGRDLPSLLQDPDFASGRGNSRFPPGRNRTIPPPRSRRLRLYYVRLGFLASAYINQVGEPPVERVAAEHCGAAVRHLPAALAPADPQLRRLRPCTTGSGSTGRRPDCLGQYRHDAEFRASLRRALVHPGPRRDRSDRGRGAGGDRRWRRRGSPTADEGAVNRGLLQIGASVWRQVAVLRRIPEKMDPALYFRTFRPYIRFFENVVYEGVDAAPLDFRGETGAQSSIMPTLVALMKIPHRPSLLTNHLADMQKFMPREHRRLIAEVQACGDLRPLADKDVYNEVLEAMATFREVHIGWADGVHPQARRRPAGHRRHAVHAMAGPIDRRNAGPQDWLTPRRIASHENDHRAVPDQGRRAACACAPAKSARRSSGRPASTCF